MPSRNNPKVQHVAHSISERALECAAHTGARNAVVTPVKSARSSRATPTRALRAAGDKFGSAGSVPSILETEATGELAEIYSDIRNVLGTSVVNLIWRNRDHAGRIAVDMVDGTAALSRTGGDPCRGGAPHVGAAGCDCSDERYLRHPPSRHAAIRNVSAAADAMHQ